MALSYNTYFAIPRLANYAEAKAHYDSVKPIRGDANGTRPAGRRDQKWFNIWMQGQDVHIGYGYSDNEHRTSLVSYSPGGTITIHRRTRYSCASDNERMQRLLKTDVQTHQYDTWVQCAWYDEGEKRKGWLPLNCNGERNWRGANPALSVFTRDAEGSLVFLNYRYPITHKPNKVRVDEALRPCAQFITFVEGMRKLVGSGGEMFTDDTIAEYFGHRTYKDWNGVERVRPNNPPQLFYGTDAAEKRELFFKQVESDDPNDRMLAAITMDENIRQRYGRHKPTPPRTFLKDLLLTMHGTAMLTATTHTTGKFVTDRYKRYLRI